MSNLPKGWALATVNDLIGPQGLFVDGDWVESKDQDPGGEVRLTQLADVGEGQWRNRSDRYLTAPTADRLGCSYLEIDDVLVARMPDPLGRACLFPGDRRPCVTVVDVAIVRPGPDSVRPRWLMWAMNSPAIRAAIEAQQAGTTRKRISRKNLGQIELQIPPLSEQQRIVTATEEAFSKLDAGEAGLRTVRQLLERMRDAILTAAVTGRLVPQDPTDTPAAKLLADLGVQPVEGADLPSGWALARAVDLLAEPLANGRSVRSQTGGFSVLRLTCLKEGTVDRRETKEGEWTAEVAAPYLIRKGDFLVSRGNGSLALVGRGGLVVDDDPPVAYPDTLIRMRLAPTTLEPRLLAIWWNSAIVRRQLEGAARTTAGIYKVNQSMIESVMLPIPAWEEQARLASEIERQLSFVEACERAVDVGLARSAGLRRSVLKAAFEGRLVPQDPSDEPATVLLERIRAERAAKPVAKRLARQTT